MAITKQIEGIIRNPKIDVMQAYHPYLTELQSDAEKTGTDPSEICYYDSYSKTYCIPKYMHEWLDKETVFDHQWRFTNGITASKVINTELNDKNIILARCYTDSYTHEKEYCIPGYVNIWTSKKILNDNHWQFIAGDAIIYKGEEAIETIADDDITD